MSKVFETIDAKNRRFGELFDANQMDDVARLYAADGLLLPSDKNKYEGREQIKKYWQGARDAGADKLRLITGKLVEAGTNQLIETSSYEHSLDRGNYQVIWKRVGEDWQIASDIFN